MEEPSTEVRAGRRARAIATVTSLEQLVGAHPDAIADVYRAGAPADPSRIANGRGRLLAVTGLAAAHVATRPLVVAVAKHLSPWRGKAFESGGTTGTDIVLGRKMFRFHSEVAASSFDSEPTLIIRYDGLGNPWPLDRMILELRTIAEGIAVGPAFWRASSFAPALWWGLADGS
jgi:hypothetical protein